ncbi:chromosome segregation protein SMC [Compostimonas suwonensis]|uniref:Chromosome partition protein Smc n=1 Tax=Compostimonas suwonensis TaxID=1048394 RepID=A0A2M9BZZ5_9MICO|nr:chromosome segregation protein SMC [Compostimonas suwonensis]PJJ63634.1 condensin subunit Smc [Compostimonas suwonensis]
MYLKSLTLKGFKSFAQATTFAFEPGVTCVVGPNGSGKSNVVDALAWVMGEQGAKTLRGGKMEDVIFAGTSTRGPLGRAEVTLTIDNTDGALPIDYSEVTISRTLFRNGSSEYAINGSNCRLLDVQELLSDSGLGREMHVIVGQGQLDAVLRASPEERRGFIEEAAGILKHRRRKEKTVRKLEAMQANLTRLNDLAGEIRRQLKPLGHQAEIAREAQSIAAVVRDARARLLADEVVSLRRALDAHNRTEHERHSERIVIQEQLEQNQLRIKRLEQEQVGDAVDLARRTSFGLESIQERLRGLFTLANQRLALLGSESESTETTPGISRQSVDDALAEVERLGQTVQAAELAWRSSQEATAAARTSLDAVDEEIAAQSALVSRHDLEITALRGRADAAASRLAAVRGEVLRQQDALDAARDRRESAQAQFALLEAEAVDADAGETNLDEAYELAQADVFEAEAEIETLRERLHTLERERDAVAAKTSALTSALDQNDGSSELIAAARPGIRGLVAEHVTVTPGFEVAIAAALGTLADAVLADDLDAAAQAVRHAVDAQLGRVEIVIAHSDSGRATAIDTAGLAGVTSATSVVTAPDGIHNLLARTVVADDLDAARAAWPSVSAHEQATIITRDGDVLSEFVLRGGSGAKRSRLELLAERDAAAERLTEVTSLIERAKFALAEQRGALQVAKEQSANALGALREFDSRLAAHTEKLNRARVQVEASAGEHERLGQALQTSEETVAQALSASEKAKGELETAESRPRPILDVSARDELYAELEKAREGEVEARLQLETARERVRAEKARAESLARQLEADRAAAEAAARRAVIRRRQADAATSVIEALPAVLASVDSSVADARLQLAHRESERASQNEELSGLRRTESGLRERLATVTEDVHGLELQIYEKKLHLSALLERAGSELGLVEDVLVAEYGPEQLVPADARDPKAQKTADAAADAARADAGPAASGPAASGPDAALAADDPAELDRAAVPDGVPFVREEQQKRLERAERKFAQLGRVNPLALEEFAALEQRHKFLVEQLTDLTNTRKDLLTIIDEIDEKMQTIFEAAFNDTQAAFGEVFPVLFPGGSGSIQLTDPENLLTTGIEVTVKPAGKKIERLSLLSGGERSLAAVALLIAIFKARPSPFYIMDEVEAALDDANLGRLLTIFEDLRATSQLIVITHQKRTMEIADALYGVSMRQDGVSAVVGQRIVPEQAAS